MRARDGTLTIIVGGSHQTLERCEPVLRVLGSNIVHMGGPGSGQTAKLCNNALVTVTVCALAESLLTGVKSGLDAKQLADVIACSSGASWLLDHWLPLTSFAGDYAPLFALELLEKDATLFTQTADEIGVPTPVTSNALQMLSNAGAQGSKDRDMTAVMQLYESLAGTELISEETARETDFALPEESSVRRARVEGRHARTDGGEKLVCVEPNGTAAPLEFDGGLRELLETDIEAQDMPVRDGFVAGTLSAPIRPTKIVAIGLNVAITFRVRAAPADFPDRLCEVPLQHHRPLRSDRPPQERGAS